MSCRIMNGSKSVVRVVVCVLIMCLLLAGCSGKTGDRKNNGTDNETIRDTTFERSETTETISAATDEEETQCDTNNVRPDDEFISEDAVPGSEPSEKPTDNAAVTIPASENDGVSVTEPSTTPTDDIASSTPENDGNDMPDYGIELPDDNWD